MSGWFDKEIQEPPLSRTGESGGSLPSGRPDKRGNYLSAARRCSACQGLPDQNRALALGGQLPCWNQAWRLSAGRPLMMWMNCFWKLMKHNSSL